MAKSTEGKIPDCDIEELVEVRGGAIKSDHQILVKFTHGNDEWVEANRLHDWEIKFAQAAIKMGRKMDDYCFDTGKTEDSGRKKWIIICRLCRAGLQRNIYAHYRTTHLKERKTCFKCHVQMTETNRAKHDFVCPRKKWIIPSYIKSKRMVTIDMTVGLSAEALAIIKKYPVAQMEMPVYFLEKVKGSSVPCKRQKRKFQTEVASAPAAKRIKRAAPVNSAPAQKQGKPVDKTTRAPRQKGQRLQKPAKPRTGSASSYSRVPSCYSSATAITSQSKTPAWSLPLSGAPVSDRIKDWLVTVEPLRKGSRLVDFDYSLDNVCCGKDKHVRGCDCWTKGG